MTPYDLHGVSMPALGLGTWQLGDAQRAVEHALSIGYPHVDTAQMFGNEAEVGAGLAASGVARADVFLTTKVWRDRVAPSRLGPSVDESLRALGTDHVDLLLLHWPVWETELEAQLETLVAVRDAGKARLVGVSNYPAPMLRDALELAPDLAVDQVEYHAMLGQDAVLDVVRQRGLVLTAYSPLAQGELLANDVVREVAEAHGATPAQVALAWLLGQDRVAAVPKASSDAHREANLAAAALALTPDDRARLDALPKDRRTVSPGFMAGRW